MSRLLVTVAVDWDARRVEVVNVEEDNEAPFDYCRVPPIPEEQKCPACRGCGLNDERTARCPECNGRGQKHLEGIT